MLGDRWTTWRQGRRARRAERWLRRSKGFWEVSPAAVELLAARLEARQRGVVRWVVLPLVALLIAPVWLMATVDVPDSSAGLEALRAMHRTFGWMALALAVGLSLVLLAATERVRRSELRIGAGLQPRVARAKQVPWWVMLGRGAVALCVLGVPLQIAVAVASVAAGAGQFAWGYAAAVVVVAALAGAGVQRVTDRPTLAVDADSLAIDDRLRTEDSVRCLACIPQLVFPVVWFPMLDVGAGWLFPLWMGVAVAVWGLWLWAISSRPWKNTPPPYPHPPAAVWPAVPGGGS